MKRKNYNLMIGGAITLFFLAVALIGQFWTPYGTTTMDSMAVNLAPCAAHPLGTDNFGRDILSRVMAGSGSTFCGSLHGSDRVCVWHDRRCADRLFRRLFR